MDKIAKLKQARQAKLAAAKAIMDAAEGRDITAEESAQALAHANEAKALKVQIDNLEAIQAEIAAGGAEAATVPQRKTSADPVRVENVRDLAASDPKRGFKSPRDYLMSVMKAGQGRGIDKRLMPLATRKDATAGSDEQGEYSDAFGGFFLPEGFAPETLQVGAEGDPTAGRTMRVPMSSNAVKINARVDKNHATSVTGGFRMYRRAETDTSASSRGEYEQVVLQANSLMGIAYATNELLADSPVSFAAIIQAGFQTEYGATLLEEKLRGTGAGQYLGVLNAPCLITVAKETSQAADTIVYQNVLNMRARCWGYGNAIWIANHDTLPQLAQMSLSVGVGGAPVYMPSAREDAPDLLMGRPIFYSEFPETLGDAGDLILGNWSQYLEGELQGPQMAESIHVRFVQNEDAFRVTARNDGRPWWRSALTPRKGANTLSPFVTLAARA